MRLISTFTAILFLCFSNLLLGQWIPTGNLTVFSDDGSKFYLILNGERYNDVAQSNVRIEELPNPYYSCRIIFENGEHPELSKRYLPIADGSGVMQDATYQIRKNRKGKYVMNFYSFIPAVQNMVRPANCAVYRFGSPNVMIMQPQQNVHHQQGGIYTGPMAQPVPPNPAASQQINMNVGGVGINLSLPDTDNQLMLQEGYINGSSVYTEPIYMDNDCITPMNPRDFSAARNSIQQNGFDETRLTIARQIAATNCLSTNQIIDVISLFSFEETKLLFAKIAYEACTDPGNYFKVNNAFTFESSKIELDNFIMGYR